MTVDVTLPWKVLTFCTASVISVYADSTLSFEEDYIAYNYESQVPLFINFVFWRSQKLRKNSLQKPSLEKYKSVLY